MATVMGRNMFGPIRGNWAAGLTVVEHVATQSATHVPMSPR